MKLKRFKLGTTVAATLSVLVATLAPTAGPASAASGPSFTVSPGPAKYSNGDSPLGIASDFTFTGSGALAESKLKFSLPSQKATETLAVKENVRIPVSTGSVYAVGSNLYLDEGAKTRSIGTVNSVLNGKGKDLQLDFSTPLVNGDFSQGSGSNIPGWTINGTSLSSGYLVRLGALATKTQGDSYVSSAVYGSGYKITGNNNSYTYSTDVNYMNTNAGNKFEGKERNLTALTSSSGTIVNGTLQLAFKGTISGTGSTPPYGTAFGPEAVSTQFTASAGDTLAFDWTAEYVSDDYEVYGFLKNVATGDHIEILYSRGKDPGRWFKEQAVVPADGTYQFRFVAGSYDASGGLALGASLNIDNVRVFSSAITSEVVSAVARLVQYSYDPFPLPVPGSEEYRNVGITFTDKDNQTATGTTQVHLWPKLLLTKVEVENATPDRAKLTFNLPIGQGSLNLNGFTVNGLPVAEVISVQGQEVDVRLAQPLGAGPLAVAYNPQAGNVEYADKPEIKLGPIQAGAATGPQAVNTVEPLKLLKVTTQYPNTSHLTLKFNKPVAGESLNLAGFTVGGKPVTLVSTNGDEVVVSLGEPYKANEPLAYNANNGNAAQAGNPNNKLETIPAGSVAILSGKINDLGLYDANNPIPLAPTFHTDKNSGYEAVVPNETAAAKIAPVALNSAETTTKVALNGVEVPNGNWNNLPLQEGINTVVTSVYNSVYNSVYGNGLLEQYTITLVRATNKLISLAPSAHQLNGTFDPTTEVYTMNVPFIQSELAWTPAAIDPQSKIEIGVNGGAFVPVASGTQSPPLALQVGDNDFVVKVTDRLGVVREYKVKATRAPATINDLSAKAGDTALTLTPSADPEKPKHYDSIVPNATATASLNPASLKASDMTVKVTLNGGEVAEGDWSSLPLQEGVNTIVTSIYKNGDPATLADQYTITIVRASNKLSSLTPSANQLESDFQPAGDSFTMRVPHGQTELAWTPVAIDPAATIEVSVNGGGFTPVASGDKTANFALYVGNNSFVVKVKDRFGEVRQYTVNVTRASSQAAYGGGGGAPATGTGATDLGTKNGNTAPFATGTKGESGTVVQVDPARLDEHLKTKNEKLSVQVPNEGDVSLKGLTADKVKAITDNGSILEVGNLLAIYPVPGGQLDLNQIASHYNNPALADIDVGVEISRAPEALSDSARKAAAAEGYEMLVDAVELELTFSHNGQTVDPGLLNGYAPRYIALPEGFDPNRITTGVVVNSDGTIFHVPTVVTKINDRYFAMINDLRSSGTYSVIWNPQDFDDVRNHWSKDAVNDIAARLDLQGTGNNTFSPNRNVNRSEFAAIVAAGMGLMRQNVDAALFGDVARAAWYHDAVKIASDFGIVEGYEDGLFRGGQEITREQGIAMIARAFSLVQSNQPMTQAQIDTALAPYGDADNISFWAKEVVARMIAAGIVEGGSGQLLNPQDSMTRAETAALMRRLLQHTGLID